MPIIQHSIRGWYSWVCGVPDCTSQGGLRSSYRQAAAGLQAHNTYKHNDRTPIPRVEPRRV